MASKSPSGASGAQTPAGKRLSTDGATATHSPASGNPSLTFPAHFLRYLQALDSKPSSQTRDWRALLQKQWKEIGVTAQQEWRQDFKIKQSKLMVEPHNESKASKRIERRFERSTLGAELHTIYDVQDLLDSPGPRLLSAAFQHAVIWVCENLKPLGVDLVDDHEGKSDPFAFEDDLVNAFLGHDLTDLHSIHDLDAVFDDQGVDLSTQPQTGVAQHSNVTYQEQATSLEEHINSRDFNGSGEGAVSQTLGRQQHHFLHGQGSQECSTDAQGTSEVRVMEQKLSKVRRRLEQIVAFVENEGLSEKLAAYLERTDMSLKKILE